MGVEVTKYLVCDHCGKSLSVDDDSFVLFELSKTHPDWKRVDDDRVLCPDCAPGYDLIQARYKVEIEDYLTRSKSE